MNTEQRLREYFEPMREREELDRLRKLIYDIYDETNPNSGASNDYFDFWQVFGKQILNEIEPKK